MTRTEFLRNATVTGANKCRRVPVPQFSVADEPCSLTERKALALKTIFEKMPVYIGENELIVGTRTWFTPNETNEDGKNIFDYQLHTRIPYINKEEKEQFGCDASYMNKTHYTPDFSIILKKGINGIINEAEQRLKDEFLHRGNIEFLSGVVIAYQGLKNLILRYSEEALALANSATGEDKTELEEIARICRKVSGEVPESFREAVQLLWFAHLGTITESFEFINYGRLDVILNKYLKGTPYDEAQQIIECLLLKMYDQADLTTTYLGTYSAQLNITLGGVLQDGKNAVNDVTMMFLDALDKTRLPEPEFSLRINSLNPTEFLERAAELTISGCNNIAYYNDDLFIKSLAEAGIPVEYARCYGFDLCQDINIPGMGDFWVSGAFSCSLTIELMGMLKNKRDFSTFEELVKAFKERIALFVKNTVDSYNVAEKQLDLYAKGRFEDFFDGVKNHKKPINRGGCCPMAPLPLLSALYHGTLEKAEDVIFVPYPIKEKGFYFGTVIEAVNSLAAIKKAVYDNNLFDLDEVYSACETDFDGAEKMRRILWECPKWGNDDSFVDDIATELLEFCLKECKKYKTYHGGQILGGIHQPHPARTGKQIMATPEGRKAFSPVAVSMTPESGTMKNGATAVLGSAAKIDPGLIHWNYCVMVNYYASVFCGNAGKSIFKNLLEGYFKMGGMQHQPNVADGEVLKKAQQNPEEYKDLIVRLWGVSARFVELSKESQDEMIARF